MRKNLAEFSKPMVGEPFEIGKNDCFHMIYRYLEFFGAEIPPEMKGLSESIGETYRLNRRIAHDAMCECFIDNFEEIEIQDMQAGDIALLSYHGSLIFTGIVLNNGNCLICSEQKGVATVPLRFYKIERILRCRDLSRL